MARAFRVLSIVVAVVALAPLTPRAQDTGRLGRIVFETSRAQAAIPAFMRGVLLLHSFEYADAKEAFLEAQRLDPDFAMAYWGEAMTYNHPLWAQQDADAARAALGRLAPTSAARLAKAPTAREKAWLTAAETLYGEGDQRTRDRAYAAAMQRLFESQPDDLEAASFYALALLGTSHDGRDFATYMKAAAIVERVYATNPQHPGAVHYLIHAYDDPVHAPLGMRAADAYARVAPAASHALHMPSHIYFAMGLWDEAAAMNERSWRAADDRVKQKKLSVDDRGFHALHWLQYAYLQAGRYQDAKRMLDTMEADAAASGSARTRSHLALMRAAWIVETRQWSSATQPVSSQSLGVEAASADLFAIGYAAAQSGDLPRAKAMLGHIRSTFGGASDGNAHHAGMPQTGLPAAGGNANSRVPSVLALQLDGVIALAENQRDGAIERLTAAAKAEDALSFEFGPPNPIKPAHELLGETLLALGQSQAARQEFEASLRRAPRRTLSMFGLARSAAASGDTVLAQSTYAEIVRIWKGGDKTLPEWKELNLATHY